MNATEVLAQAVERHHPRLVMLCSFQKEESVLVDELVRARARRPHRHDRHRRAVPGDARDLAGVRGALRRRRRDRGRHRRLDRPGALLRRAQGRGAGARAGRRRRLDHRHPPRAVADARRRAAGRVRREARDLEVQPARRVDREGPLAPHRRARPAVPPAARPGLRLDRLRAVHAARQPAARAAGPGCPRPSAVCTSGAPPKLPLSRGPTP